MSDAHHLSPRGREKVYEVVTPATLNVPSSLLAPMAGGQDQTCNFAVHQNVCVTGQVKTFVTPICRVKTFCKNFGIGPFECPPPTSPCDFKFFANLCVEVDVTLEANAECTINPPVCSPPMEGPCPPVDG